MQRSKIKDQRYKSKFKNFKKHFKFLFVILIFTFYILNLFPAPVYADPVPCGPNDPNFGPCPAGLSDIENMAASVISVVVYLGFMVMLVLIVWTGIKYLTSGGEPKAIQAAHQTLTWALLGVVFLAIAWLILQLIAGFTGINTLTIFNIKTLCGGTGLPFCK